MLYVKRFTFKMINLMFKHCLKFFGLMVKSKKLKSMKKKCSKIFVLKKMGLKRFFQIELFQRYVYLVLITIYLIF